MPTLEDVQATREEFLSSYATDPEFHAQVDALLWDDVVRLRDEVTTLRAALGRIGYLKRDDFRTGFEYEMTVRRVVDAALGKIL
jgi:uncharacterized protein YbjT (DUF2867 family)